MRYTQLINFELASTCPFAADHQEFCPAFKIPRGIPIDDQLIIDSALCFYKDTEFTGLIGFHYYCEPWAERERMGRIMRAILESQPAARFLLWTNAVMHVFSQNESAELLPLFEQVHVTVYKDLEELESATALRNIALHCPNIFVHYQKDDDRIHPQMPKPGPCFLPFLEMSFDAAGKVHACCYDWKGEINLGNIKDGVIEVVEKWKEFRSQLTVAPHGNRMMGRLSHDRCNVCGHRNPNICSIDDYIAHRTVNALKNGDV